MKSPSRKYATIEDIKPLEEAFRTLNRELGEIQGELRILKWFMGGTLLVLIGQWITSMV